MLVVLDDPPYGLSSLHELVHPTIPERLTVSHYGRNIHFIRTDTCQEVEGRPAPVFQWSYNTAIAE